MDDAAVTRLLDGVAWLPVGPPADCGPGDLYATHEGFLELAGFRFRCYRLNDGRRVFDAADVGRFFLGGDDA